MFDWWQIGMFVFITVFIGMLFPNRLGIWLGVVGVILFARLIDWFFDIRK